MKSRYQHRNRNPRPCLYRELGTSTETVWDQAVSNIQVPAQTLYTAVIPNLSVHMDPFLTSTEFRVPPHAVIILASVHKIRVTKKTVANAANSVNEFAFYSSKHQT